VRLTAKQVVAHLKIIAIDETLESRVANMRLASAGRHAPTNVRPANASPRLYQVTSTTAANPQLNQNIAPSATPAIKCKSISVTVGCTSTRESGLRHLSLSAIDQATECPNTLNRPLSPPVNSNR